ncbi:helix-turn-helix transcriptional regulator [Leadbetterella byssophila]|uniref:Helix-turn-helix domain protein n=1 Tax=Leadbetterella byssophila (strain DSM 17132 / JCM 16389 / KACC 11308 / NBRC 106382 / 4M15) TaxID=649349 RepID=E4RVK5_LEAB4|nr:helix-turn-helix transcriptional regulator [Leadbetterella byssophila]ADQ17069.1 helix-turn-helix domain protein [Leadbetterella byssophila DSM 17132]
MNKIAFTARQARGLSKGEVARELGISEADYNELELELTPMSSEMAEKLAAVYNIPAEYFMIGSFYNIQMGIDALKQQKEIINNSALSENLPISIPAQFHMRLAKLGLEAVIANQEKLLLLRQNRELEFENNALRTLYKSTKNVG